jgi:hypothetical protein
MQPDGKKLSYIMMVAIHNLCVECGQCTVKMYENVLSNVVKVTNAS